MPFELPAVDGVDSEIIQTLTQSETVQNAIAEYVQSQIEPAVSARTKVAREDFKKRMDALDAKRVAAEEQLAASNLDPEELQALREARDKNPELQATLDAMKKQQETRDAEFARVQEQMQELRRTTTVNQAINEYNTEHKTRQLKPDAADLVTLLAKDALRFDPDSNTFKVYGANDELLATDKGAATPVDWLVKVRSERPSLFDPPTGGGAPGSGNPGSADKSLTRSEFAALAPVEQAKVAQTHTITDG